MTTLAQDLRHTLRRLGQTPRFTSFAVFILAIAFGAHLSVVGVIDSVLLTPAPVSEPGGLLAIHETRDGARFRSMAYGVYVEVKSQSEAFGELAAHYPTALLHIELDGASEMVNGAIASANYFSLLGVEPGLGRFFRPEEDRTRGTHAVVVLSDALWQTRLGGDESVLGSVVKINNTPFTVVGVAPPGFVGLDPGRPCELWIPTMMADAASWWCDALSEPKCKLFEMIGRLAEGQTLRTAEAEMDILGYRLEPTSRATEDVVYGLGVAPLTGLDSERGRSARQMVGLLMAVVTLVIVVACANLCGLLIGRGLTRRREIAVRLALGASRFRAVSLFVLEAMVLTLAGGIAGLLVAAWAGPLGPLAFGSKVPIEVEISASVLGYTGLLCVFVGLVVGLVPGWQASRSDVTTSLKEAAGQAPGRRSLMAVFVVVQIAVSFLLLHSTGLLSRSLVNITGSPSVEPANIATLRLRPRLVGYQVERGEAAIREVWRQIESLPGVQSVGFAKHRPLWPGFETSVRLPDEAPSSGGPSRMTGLQPVGPQALEAVGIPIVRGRDFDLRDDAESPPVLLVNRTLAESLWPGRDAVGERVILRQTSHEVIGVVQDCPYQDLIWGRSPQAYSAFWQDLSHPDARFVVRFDGGASASLPALRELVRDVDPAIPVTEVGTLEQQLRRELSEIHVASRLTGIAGFLALLLSAAGLSSVLALAVVLRMKEIGIRKALGASHGQVISLVVRDAMVLVGFALGCGLLASAALGPTLGQYLHGVDAHDPLMLVATMLVIPVVAGMATWWPARRAAQVDPIATLKL